MCFVDTLNLQIINKCLDRVNSIENIIPVLKDFEKRYDAALENNNEICEANIYDYSFKKAHINTVNIPFPSSYMRYTMININDNSYGSLDDLSRLYKSLYVIPYIEDEFSNPSEIAWDKLLTQVIEITPYDYTCEERICHNANNVEYILEYDNIDGYTGINHLESINNTVKQLTSIDNIYSITDSKTLDNGVFQDERNQDFLYLTPDGDYLQANAGIVILDEYKQNDLLVLNIIKYVPDITYDKDVEIDINGHKFIVNDLDANEMIIETVYNHLDEFTKYELVVKNNGEDCLYQLLSMKKLN